MNCSLAILILYTCTDRSIQIAFRLLAVLVPLLDTSSLFFSFSFLFFFFFFWKTKECSLPYRISTLYNWHANWLSNHHLISVETLLFICTIAFRGENDLLSLLLRIYSTLVLFCALFSSYCTFSPFIYRSQTQAKFVGKQVVKLR